MKTTQLFIQTLVCVAILIVGLCAPVEFAGSSQFEANNVAVHNQLVASSLYRSLTEAIDQTDEASLVLSLYDGATRTHIEGTDDILWAVAPGTTASLKLRFVEGKWKTLSLKFQKAIRAQFRTDTPLQKTHEITQINFNNDGTPREYFDLFGQPIPLSLSNFPEVRRHLKLPGSPGEILEGKTFAGLDQSAIGSQKALQVRRLGLAPSSSGPKPLLARLRQGQTLRFRESPLSAGSACADSVTLQESSGITFSNLSYSIDTGELHVEIPNPSLKLSAGCLSVDETVLKLGPESNLQYSKLTLSSGPNGINSVIRGDQGTLTARLANDSFVVLATSSDRKLSFKPASSSLVELRDHSLEYSSSSNKISAGANSSFTFQIVAAAIPLAGDSAITLKGGNAAATFKGLWETGKPPSLTGTFQKFTGRIESGTFALPGTQSIPLRSGDIEAAGMSLSSVNLPFLAGRINSLRAKIAPATSLSVPNNKTVTVTADAEVVVTPSDQLMLIPNTTTPEGNVSLQLPFSTLLYAATPHVHLENGVTNAVLMLKSDPPQLVWDQVKIDGEQVGSYNLAEELPADEYQTVATFPNGKVMTVVPHRGMIVNTIQTKSETPITFHETRRIKSATLAKNSKIGGVPLQGGTVAVIYRTEIRVKSGTLAEPFTVEGQQFPAGTFVTIPWIKFVPATVLTLSDADTLLRHVQTGVDDRLTALLDADTENPGCIWGTPKTAKGLTHSKLPRRIEANAFVYPSNWVAPGMLRNAAPLPSCDCQVLIEPRITLTINNKTLIANAQPLLGNVKYSCSTCPWYSFGVYSDYVRGIWADSFDRALRSETALVDALQALVEQRGNAWAVNAPSLISEAEAGTFFFKDVTIRATGVEITFGYQVL